MSMAKFRGEPEMLKTWIGIAESYWAQFSWIKKFDTDADDIDRALVTPTYNNFITSDAVF